MLDTLERPGAPVGWEAMSTPPADAPQLDPRLDPATVTTLDEAAPVDAGRVLGAGLILAAVSALAPAAFGGKVLQSYDVSIDFGRLSELATPLGPLTVFGSPHLVTSVFFDVGVYLVVLGLMLDILRSFGTGIDAQIRTEQQLEEQDSGEREGASVR